MFNKNSILAFVLIALTVVFFSSSLWNNFWYGKVLKKPIPTQQVTPPPQAAQPKAEEKEEVPSPDTLAPVQSSDSTNTAVEVEQTQNEKTVVIETNKYIATISTKGGRIISLKMKDYFYNGDRKDQMIDLVPKGSEGGAQLAINNESFDDKFFTTEADTVNPVKVGDKPYELAMEVKAANGKTIRKVFSFSNDTYKIGYTVQGEDIKNNKVILSWKGGIEESEQPSAIDKSSKYGGDKRRAHYSDGKTVQHFEMNKNTVEEPAGQYRWVGMTSKYFFIGVVADTVTDADLKIEGKDHSNHSKIKDINYSVSFQKMADENKVESWIYAGPSKVGELSVFGLKFEKIMFPVLGWPRHILWADSWFPPIAEIILKVMLFLYGLVKDYGVAIILLTALSKLITYPMTASSTKSMNRLKDVQPKINALRNKHKNNPQKMNEELMALYKAEGINPLNPGCLPMFLQMPIFIALFVVLRKAVELRGAASFLLPWVKDLSQPEVLFTLPGAGIPFYGANVALMPIIMAVLTFFQQKMTIKDPNQKAMIYMMPIIMLIMFNGFPAGVVFYWTLSSAFGLVQQIWMNKKSSTPAAVPVTVGGTTSKAGKKQATR